VKWYHKAAEQGHAFAQCQLAMHYYKGEGVDKDYVEAAKWYHKAAEQGNVVAQGNLANCYHTGEGVNKDYVEAAKWNREAAANGHEMALLRLGHYYAEGLGVEKDDVKACSYYILAGIIYPSNEKALEMRDELTKTLTPSQRSEAERRAFELKSKF
jgi:TPR repeat protein